MHDAPPITRYNINLPARAPAPPLIILPRPHQGQPTGFPAHTIEVVRASASY